MFVSVLSVIFVFGVLIVAHELGHLWTARRFGVRVELFTFGFGPRLFGFRRGETLYQVALIPFGGAVKLAGEESLGKKEPKRDEYFGRPPGERALILVMGSVHNFILGFLLFTLAFSLGVQTFNYRQPLVGEVKKGFPAESAGLKSGDLVLSVEGKKVTDWFSLSEEIRRYPDKAITLIVERKSEILKVKVMPKRERIIDSRGEKTIGLIGIFPVITKEKMNLFQAFLRAGKESGRVVGLVFYYLGKLITRKVSSRELAGPIGIAQLTSQFAKAGLSNFISFLALLSINLSVVNLFPLPFLDGGHLVGVLIERVRRRRPSRRFLEVGQALGLFLIILLALFVTYNDLLRISNIHLKIFGRK